jgi:hypothetical protein
MGILISKSNTVVEFTLSAATQEEWHDALRSSYPRDHADPIRIDAIRCRVVFEKTTFYGHSDPAAVFARAIDAVGDVAWLPLGYGTPVRSNWVVAIAARALVMQLMVGDRPIPEELSNGSLFVDLGEL